MADARVLSGASETSSESSSLVINNESSGSIDSSNSIDNPRSDKPRFYNTEEYWTVWIGLTWYVLTILLTLAGIDVAFIKPWSGADIVVSLTFTNIAGMLLVVFATFLTLYIAHKSLGREEALWQYGVIIFIVLCCKVIGSFNPVRLNGIGDPIWCILFGLVLKNVILRHSTAFKPVCGIDFFIKISIVLLALNLRKVALSGAKGLVVAWIETILLVIAVYLIGLKLFSMCPNESILTSGCLSICGGSAAMAIGQAINADKITIASLITIMSIFTMPLIPTIPIVAKHAGFNNETTGAWIGGCVDTTGAVSASGSLGGVYVLQTAIVIKMLQNVLIGPIVLTITAVWHKTFEIMILWEKFPKFVLGFMLVCIITTLLPDFISDRVITNSFILSEWFSSISFVLIGLDIDLSDLQLVKYKKMIALYILGQLIDIGTTLASAYLMFAVI